MKYLRASLKQFIFPSHEETKTARTEANLLPEKLPAYIMAWQVKSVNNKNNNNNDIEMKLWEYVEPYKHFVYHSFFRDIKNLKRGWCVLKVLNGFLKIFWKYS